MKTLNNKLAVMLCSLLFALGCVTPIGAAQTNSNTATVALTMSVGNSITISATPGTIAFTPDGTGKLATASGPISVTTAYAVGSSDGLSVNAWFSDPTTALTQGAYKINTGKVLASINSGATSACNQTVANSNGVNGATCPNIATVTNAGVGTRTDSVLLSINNGAAMFAPGSYTGTLTLQANTY